MVTKEKQKSKRSSGSSADQERSFVTVSGLSKYFGEVKAVEDASFGVGDGEFFSIIGPSGSGKTTLLRMLAGFEMPTAGTIQIDERECTDEKPYHRNTNMIFQDLALFPHLNVKENIAYGLVEAGEDEIVIVDKVTEALENVDLAGYQDREISELSGGEKQRVALARGLINEPDVLLLDEPLAALDEKLKESMKVELKRIQDRTGTTFIYVTHDQEVAMAMSDRIAVLRDGKIQQIDTPETLYMSPRNAFVANFTGSKNIFDVDPSKIDKQTGTVKVEGIEFGVDVSSQIADPEAGGYQVILRQESVRISVGDGPVSGTVTDMVYKGALVEMIIDVTTGTGSLEFVAEVHHEDVADIQEGATVRLDWDDDSVLLVTER